MGRRHTHSHQSQNTKKCTNKSNKKPTQSRQVSAWMNVNMATTMAREDAVQYMQLFKAEWQECPLHSASTVSKRGYLSGRRGNLSAQSRKQQESRNNSYNRVNVLCGLHQAVKFCHQLVKNSAFFLFYWDLVMQFMKAVHDRLPWGKSDIKKQCSCKLMR